jgi:hypothetical protein
MEPLPNSRVGEMPDIQSGSVEIERMRCQVRGDQATSTSRNTWRKAEVLLDRMLNQIDDLWAERDRLKSAHRIFAARTEK